MCHQNLNGLWRRIVRHDTCDGYGDGRGAWHGALFGARRFMRIAGRELVWRRESPLQRVLTSGSELMKGSWDAKWPPATMRIANDFTGAQRRTFYDLKLLFTTLKALAHA